MNRLDEIREQFNSNPDWGVYDGMLCRSDLALLLAEVERLQKENEKIKATVYVCAHVAAELKDMIFGKKPVQEELFAKLIEKLKEAEML